MFNSISVFNRELNIVNTKNHYSNPSYDDCCQAVSDWQDDCKLVPDWMFVRCDQLKVKDFELFTAKTVVFLFNSREPWQQRLRLQEKREPR